MSLLANVSLSRILATIKSNGGFLTNVDLRALKEHDRLRQVLVRCNNCRFLCAAQDAEHLCDIIDASEKDWVRDVSLPTTDPIWK
jgi:hypothetical protein